MSMSCSPRQGLDVAVLEASDRVGGRTYSVEIDSTEQRTLDSLDAAFVFFEVSDVVQPCCSWLFLVKLETRMTQFGTVQRVYSSGRKLHSRLASAGEKDMG